MRPTSRPPLRATAGAAPATVVAPAYTAGKRIAIIGSGYGGAVAARSLSTRGYRCEVIEMGMDWSTVAPTSDGKVFPSMAKPNGRAMWFQDRTEMPFTNILGISINQPIDRRAGALGIERFAQMKVYVGRGVGGGSLVNGGMSVTPRRSFFEQILPAVDAEEMYGTYFPLANQMLGVAPPALDVLAYSPYFQYARLGALEGQAAGYTTKQVPNVYDWDYMRRESAGTVTRSAMDQEVIFGNNHGKKDVTKTILKDALATGLVTLTPMTEVTSLRHLPDGTFELSLKTITFEGAVVSTRTAVYDKVVLAGGSVGTSKLLAKAKATGTVAGLPSTVGQKWGPNGNIMSARYLYTKGLGGRQSGIPVLGIEAWDDSPSSVFAEIAPFPTGIETFTSVYLSITNNANYGTFTWNTAADRLDLSWTTAMSAPSVTAARALMDRLNAVNGGTTRTDLFDDGKAFADYFSYHPLGGAVLGDVTDLSGEVKGVPGLFVVDSALIPAKLGVNPLVTVTAMAQRSMDRLISAGRFA